MISLAHGIGGRTDLPVPLWLAVYGAAAAVVFSFAALGVLWPRPRLRGAEAGRPLPGWLRAVVESPVTAVLLRAAVLGAALLTVAAAQLGSPDAGDNPAPWWFYIFFWVGLVPLSLLFGPFWRAVNPLRTVHVLLSRLTGSDPDRGSRQLPERLGYWPAVAWLTGFAWLELVYPARTDPQTVGGLLIVYALVNLVAAAVYGSGWFARGDGFEVYSTLVGHMSPFGRRRDGTLVARSPLNGLDAIDARPGLVGVVVVLLGTTAFDGVTRARWWLSFAGPEEGWPAVPKLTLGLVATLAVVGLTYVLATRLAGRPAGADPGGLPDLFAHSVVPIAVGYAVAHYFSLALLDGQYGVILASDPFYRHADWFGTARWGVNLDLVSPWTIAVVQICGIVVGHVVGVVSAHDRAVRLFPGRAGIRGQYPLLAVMVAYTLGGVTLLLSS